MGRNADVPCVDVQTKQVYMSHTCISSPEPYFMCTKRLPVLGIKHVILMYFDCYLYFYASKMCCIIRVCVCVCTTII